METINTIELSDERIYPDENVLRGILGKSYDAYSRLLSLYTTHELAYAWKYYHDGKTWLCKVQQKKRTLVWMSAWKGYMQATLYFPEKYIERVYELGIREETKTRIRETKNVGKSKPCIFEIRDEKILGDFENVLKLKIECK